MGLIAQTSEIDSLSSNWTSFRGVVGGGGGAIVGICQNQDIREMVRHDRAWSDMVVQPYGKS